MAKLTKTDAARQLGIARSTLYKSIDQGKVSATPDGMIDQAKLVRIATFADTLRERARTSAARRGERSRASPSGPRDDMRRRIIALLQEHPEGLSPAQTRHLLGADKDLHNTMKAMVRDGLIRRVETGRYRTNESSRTQ